MFELIGGHEVRKPMGVFESITGHEGERGESISYEGRKLIISLKSHRILRLCINRPVLINMACVG